MSAPSRPTPLGWEDRLLLAAVLLLPWAFGGVEIWAYRFAAFLLVGAATVALWKRGAPGGALTGDTRPRWLAPAVLLAVWGAVQLIPLPPPAVRLASPSTYEIYSESLPGYPGAPPRNTFEALEARALERVPESRGAPLPVDLDETRVPPAAERRHSSWRPLSLQPSATLERLAWYVALLLGFLTVRGRVGDAKLYRGYRFALFGLFTALAAFGLFQLLLWNGKIYWLRPSLSRSLPFGPYINRAHFGGVMELAVPWLAGYAWERFRIGWRTEERLRRIVLSCAALVVCLVACVATGSRGATGLIAIALAILGVLSARSTRTRLAIAGLSVVLLVSAGVLLSRTPLGEKVRDSVERSEGADLAEPRLAAWYASSDMLRQFAVTGTGFGAFREVFQRYVPRGARTRWAHAHNDYLEVVLEGGIVVAGLLAWLVWGYGSRLWRGLRRAMAGQALGRVGLVLGIVSLGLHGLVDFNHQIPANALLFVVACAMALPIKTAAAGESSVTARGGARVPLAALSVVYGYRAVAGTIAGIYLLAGAGLTTEGKIRRSGSEFERAAVGFNRFEATRRAGQARLARWDKDAEDAGPLGADEDWLQDSAAFYEQCVWLAPGSWRPWAGLASVYDRWERIDREKRSMKGLRAEGEGWARIGRSGRVAVGLLREAIDRAPNWYPLHDRQAELLWRYGLEEEALESVRMSARVQPRFIPHNYYPIPSERVRDAFVRGSRESLGQVPLMPKLDHLVVLAKLEKERGALGPAEDALAEALGQPGTDSDRAAIHNLLGLVQIEAGRYDEARASLDRASEDPEFRLAALTGLVRIATETGQAEVAMSLFRRLRWESSDDLEFRLRYARIARQLEQWPEAVESLERGLRIDPEDPRVYTGLIQTHLESGDLEAARTVLARLERLIEEEEDETFDLGRWRRAIDRADPSASVGTRSGPP